MVEQDVHVDTLGPACRESRGVIFLLNETPDASQDHGPRVDGLEVATRHLQHQAHLGRDGGDEPCASLDAAAALILLWIVRGDVEVCTGQVYPKVLGGDKHTFFQSQVDKLDKMVAGGEDEVLVRHDERCAILC